MKQHITQIINEWDPIDLFPMAPENEYIREIEIVENIIIENSNLSIRELGYQIQKVFLDRFGSDVYTQNINDCFKIAEKILAE